MKQTHGTDHSTNGLPGATGGVPGPKLWLAGLALTALLGSALVFWVGHTTWWRLKNLQQELGGLRADNFYLGVRARGEVQRLNDTLLRYRLRSDTNDAAAFLADAEVFKQWLDKESARTTTPVERRFFDRVTAAYDDYLTESTQVLAASRGWLGLTPARDFKKSYEKVQSQSRDLMDVCDSFISKQRCSFAGLLRESNDTLTGFMRLLELLVALMLPLVAVLVVMVYRGMIAPLRHQLAETHALIGRQEKLASLGALAAGVAHEIRNPLTAIKFRLHSLKKHLPGAGAEDEDAGVIGSELTRLERILQDFLQFARPSEPELAAMPVQRLFDEVRGLLGAQLEKAAIELKAEPADAAWVRADAQQIKQVLINLVQNAADSIGRNGVITLRARDGSGFGPEGGPETVSLEVADNGKGIPPEVRKRLFDPFFTTKEGGTGLGLPIAARIVEKHGGQLRYQTKPRCGTTFSVILPRVHGHEYESQDSLDRG
ncbi:MAG: sensor histidine kinase [Limisphaerales bacterium]